MSGNNNQSVAIVTYVSLAQRYYKRIERPMVGPLENEEEEPMRSQFLHVAVLIAAFGVSTSLFAATLV